MMGSKRAGLALVLGAAVAMAACKKSENYASDTGAAKADTGFAVGKADTGMAAAPAAPAALTDANIVYILDNANMQNCNLSDVSLVGMSLSGANLQSSTITGLTIGDNNLTGTSFSGLDLTQIKA